MAYYCTGGASLQSNSHDGEFPFDNSSSDHLRKSLIFLTSCLEYFVFLAGGEIEYFCGGLLDGEAFEGLGEDAPVLL